MSNPLNVEEKTFCVVALSKVQAIQSLLTPLTEKSSLISRIQEHLREASVLLALAIYKKPE